MKKVFLLIATLVLSVTLAACGTQNNDDSTNADKADEGTTNTEDQNNDNNTDDQNDNGEMNDDNTTDAATDDDIKKKMDELDYTDFELEVDYGKNKEFEAEIEQDGNGVEADLEDELNGVDVNGEEAFNKIYPNVKKLTIDRDTNKDDAIKDVLKAFDLDADYTKLELELTFKDGTKVEFEDKK